MSWMWAVELIPLSVRGPANALATAANWIANFIVVLVTPNLFLVERYRTYIIFAVFNFAIVPTIYLLYPETGGRSLEEIDVVFRAAGEGSAGKKGGAWTGVVGTAKLEPRWFDRNGDPTDSFGGSEKGGESDLEKVGSSGSERSPDSSVRNHRPSTARETWDAQHVSAPAPAVLRHSNDRARSR